jgi:hypothetical protein
MKSNNPRIQRLKEMLILEERRAILQQDLDSLTEQLSVLKEQLFSSDASSTAAPAKAARAAKGRVAVNKPSAKKTSSGSLRDKVIAALEAAGDSGIYVKDLAEAIGIKPVNIHSWFHSNIKRHPAIKKITGGHYRLVGDAASVTPKAKPGPKSKASAPKKAAKAPKGAKAPKAARADKGGSKRGELSANILEELKAAGKDGITVSSLADKLGAKYKNIYIWFATTGKKNSHVKKVGPATYKLTE